jgi:hypothetical protein
MKKFFSLIWRGWKKFAHVLGIINTRILLTVSYFVIFAIAAAITRITGKDLLDRRMKPAQSYYGPHDPVQASLETSRRQF